VLAKSNSRCRFEGCPILRSVVDCIGDIGQLNVNYFRTKRYMGLHQIARNASLIRAINLVR
jgi:hypothetical protein